MPTWAHHIVPNATYDMYIELASVPRFWFHWEREIDPTDCLLT